MPNIIDLFSGVGGLSLAAARAGFTVSAAVENDPIALETHSLNFPNSVHIDQDISTLSGEELFQKANLQTEDLCGLIGGPPCQGFSTMGRRAEGDARNNLFNDFFRLVQETQPNFFLAENVPGIMDTRYDEVRNNAFDRVRGNYTLLNPIKVSANQYGAPTTRTRIFFFGYNADYFEDITHDDFHPPEGTQEVRIREALEGLPTDISPDWKGSKEDWRILNGVPDTPFGLKASGQPPEGVGHQYSIDRYLNDRVVSGCKGTLHREGTVERFSTVLPGKQDKISKAPRLHPEGFCPTLRAGTARDKGSYQAVRPIHPTEHRVITVREASRLQGFPDWFVFHKTKWHSFRQIGNSVSPIPAEHLLRVIFEKIR